MSDFESAQHSQISLKAAQAKQEIQSMAQEAIKYINASVERYNRSAGQSRRRWEEKIRSNKHGST